MFSNIRIASKEMLFQKHTGGSSKSPHPEERKEADRPRELVDLKLSPIESMVKEGNEIKEFYRHLFETMVEKVIVGEGDDPYKIKFFLKTKQQYNVNATEYILKNKVGKTIKGITYQQQATDFAKQEIDKFSSTCGVHHVATPKRRQK